MAKKIGDFLKGLLGTEGLSKYDTYGKVDEGRMSVIYKARDKRTMRTCFLKIYKEDCIRIRNAIRRKQPEIDEVLLSLAHPNVMKVYEFGSGKGHEYCAIEAIDGEALGSMAREGKISWQNAIGVFAKVAEGLTYFHDEKRLIHRDLNPYNIVVTPQLEPKIIDLDFTIMETSDTAGMYRRSGTVAYLSPEQVRGQHLDHRVDVYAFGVTMYETLTGVNPYWDREEQSEQLRLDRTTYHHLVLVPDPPSTLRTYIPKDVDALITGCLEINRIDRIQTAVEVASRLREIVENNAAIRDAQMRPAPAQDRLL